MPSSHLILCHPLLLLPPIPPSIRIFSNESTLHMRWPKYWSFSFSIIPSKEIPGLNSFRIDWLDLLAVQGTLKSLLLLGAGVRHSTHGKGHEEGGSKYAKAGSSLRSPPGNPHASTPITRACLLSYFALSPTPLTLRRAVPHYFSMKKEITYSSS